MNIVGESHQDGDDVCSIVAITLSITRKGQGHVGIYVSIRFSLRGFRHCFFDGIESIGDLT